MALSRRLLGIAALAAWVWLLCLPANAQTNHTIALSAAPAAGGSVSGTGTFADGSSRTVHAAPSIGYAFVNWTDGGNSISTDASYTFTLNTDRTLIANFVSIGDGAGMTERASVNSTGNEAVNESSSFNESAVSTISADGRFVVFLSYASNLVVGDANATVDVFLRSRETGVTERINVSSAGVEANFGGSQSSISSDGNDVAFGSGASNLVPGDTNDESDIFVRDRQAGTTTRVNVSNAATQANGESRDPKISANGRVVTFYSRANNLVTGDTNGDIDVFAHDRDTGLMERISLGVGGAQANNSSGRPAINSDGRFVAFHSYASNLVSGDTNNKLDVFVRDRQSGTTERISISSTGGESAGESFAPFLSPDGRFVTFSSEGPNLIVGDTNGVADVFLHDRQNGTTERISVDSAGGEANGRSQSTTSISADGRFVVFYSEASNLVSGDTNGQTDVFVHDRFEGSTVRASVNSAGGQAWSGGSYTPSVSDDGRLVAFESNAGELVGGDTNEATDIFVRDVLATVSASASSAGGGVSGDGDYLVGSSRTVTAAASTGYVFVDWTESGTPVSTEASYTFTLTADRALVANFAADGDEDGVPDVSDNCPVTANGDQANNDGDSSGDACDGDDDNDTINDGGDNCQFVVNFNQANNDGDGSGDACDSDDDDDGVSDASDNCQFVANVGQADLDGDGIGDACDSTDDTDTDSDGVPDTADNCPGTENTDQTDSDNDGLGDLCDDDNDNDGVIDTADNCPAFANPNQEDADGDGVGDFCDAHYTIALSVMPASSGTVSGAGTFADGVSRTVTATPNAGYRFVKWTEGGVERATTAGYTFPVTANRTLVANFIRTHMIAVSASPAAGGTVTGGGAFDKGSSRTVTATPNAGYRFVKWTEGGVQKATTASYTFNVTANRNLVANFVRTFTISVSALPAAGGTVAGGGTFDQGSSKTVTASPKPGYVFSRWLQGGALASNKASFTFTLNANRTLVAQFGVARRKNDLLVDFGSSGLYRYLNNANWQKLHNSSPIAIGAGDLDGSGKDEAIASIAGQGLFVRYNNGPAWVKRHNSAPARLAVGDFDGNGKDDLAIDLGAAGIWVLKNNTLPFVKINASASQGLATGDLDGNGKVELLADLSTGLWVLYNNGTTWTKIYPISPALIATGDLDGNRKDEVVIGRGASGIFVRYNNAGIFTKVHPSASQGLATGDLDGNGREELIADLGATGLWARYNNSETWTKRHNSNPVGILAADLDKTGRAEIIADFGAGIFVRYNNAGAFVRRNPLSSQALTAGGFD